MHHTFWFQNILKKLKQNFVQQKKKKALSEELFGS